jgi:hypothetical protein
MYKFYIPFLYTLETRFETRTKKLALFLTYFIPVTLTYLLLYHNIYHHMLTESLIVYLLGVFTVYNTYEIGYIENDTELIKNEENPTMRLNQLDLSYYERNKYTIYSFRIILIISFVGSIRLFQGNYSTAFIAAILALLIIFKIYNIIRSRLNLLLQFFLSSLRYLSIFLLILPSSSYGDFLIFLFIFPIINIIEWATKPRFNIKRLIKYYNNIYLIRVIYYITFLTIGYIYFTNNQFYYEYLLIMFYFLLYRTVAYYKLTQSKC